jgi:hypothetical protein
LYICSGFVPWLKMPEKLIWDCVFVLHDLRLNIGLTEETG